MGGRALLTALALLTVGATAGCSSAVNGSPQPDKPPSSPQSTSTSNNASAQGPAPTVPGPLNVKPYLGKNVCYILDEKQAQSIGFHKPHASPRQHAMGPDCVVSDRGKKENYTPDDLSVGFQPRFSLNDVYKRKSNWRYFRPGSIQGYPYVIGSAYDDRPDGYCTLHLAVTDKVTSDISYSDNKTKNGQHACEMTKKTASEVVTTLKNTK